MMQEIPEPGPPEGAPSADSRNEGNINLTGADQQMTEAQKTEAKQQLLGELATSKKPLESCVTIALVGEGFAKAILNGGAGAVGDAEAYSIQPFYSFLTKEELPPIEYKDAIESLQGIRRGGFTKEDIEVADDVTGAVLEVVKGLDAETLMQSKDPKEKDLGRLAADYQKRVSEFPQKAIDEITKVRTGWDKTKTKHQVELLALYGALGQHYGFNEVMRMARSKLKN